MARLTEYEIRGINQFILEGKPLPDKYRFLLFDKLVRAVGGE